MYCSSGAFSTFKSYQVKVTLYVKIRRRNCPLHLLNQWIRSEQTSVYQLVGVDLLRRPTENRVNFLPNFFDVNLETSEAPVVGPGSFDAGPGCSPAAGSRDIKKTSHSWTRAARCLRLQRRPNRSKIGDVIHFHPLLLFLVSIGFIEVLSMFCKICRHSCMKC